MSYDYLKVTNEAGFACIAMDRPPRNLLDPRSMSELRRAILTADQESDGGAIVLTGCGGVFCGGLDIAQIQAGADPVAFGVGLVELLRILPGLGKPFIVAVNGDALASGYSLVCAADVAVAVEGARIGTIEAGAGIWPMIAQVPALQRLAPRHALENLLTGEPFTAARAREVGIVNDVVAADQLWDAIGVWVMRTVRAGAALAGGRRSFYRFLDLDYDQALDASLEEFGRLFEA